MLRILFWNTNRHKKKIAKKTVAEKALDNEVINKYITTLITTRDPDIFVFCEYDYDSNILLTKLNTISKRTFSRINLTNERLKIFTTIDQTKIRDNLDNLYGSNHSSIIQIEHPSKRINLFTVHFPSKLYWSDQSQSIEGIELMSKIRELEKTSNKNTIVIGDFNMNPFEYGMVSSLGLHALKDNKKISSEISRKIYNREYDFFYNPMWNFLGDFKNPIGSYYHRNNEHISFDWHTFDQVIFRPELADNFKGEDVELIYKIGGESILTSSNQPKKNISDHLPLCITFNFPIL